MDRDAGEVAAAAAAGGQCMLRLGDTPYGALTEGTASTRSGWRPAPRAGGLPWAAAAAPHPRLPRMTGD